MDTPPGGQPNLMGDLRAQENVQEASIEAVVIRADGTREELGVVSYWHRNFWKRLFWRLRHG